MIQLKNVSKTYHLKGGVAVHALDHLSLSLPEKGLLFVLGKSGSGKSTLLNLLGALDRPDEGEIVVDGVSMKDFSGKQLDAYRNTYLGFIFQEYNILNDYTVGANIGLALSLQKKKNEHGEVEAILEKVGLGGLSSRHPKELSGGQKQRVAIARALVKSPRLLLADEPTGALDSKTGEAIFDLLKELAQDRLVLVVSHDRDFAERFADRIIEIKDGRILSDVVKKAVVEKRLSPHITLLKNGLLSISSGKDLSEEELTLLDETLQKGNEETILSSNEKSIITFKAQNGLHAQEGGYSFEPIEKEPEPDRSERFAPVPAKLPFKDSFKMGASGLRLKPVRLVFMILLAAFSLSIFALTDSIFAYSPLEAATLGLAQADLNYLSVYKIHFPNENYGESQILTEADILTLKKDTGIDFLRTEKLTFSYAQNVPSNNSYGSLDATHVFPYGSSSSLGVYTEKEAATLGLTLYGRYPSLANEVALSGYAYSLFENFGYVSYSDLENKTARLSLPAHSFQSEEEFLKKGITLDRDIYDSATGQVSRMSFQVTGILSEGFDKTKFALLDKQGRTSEEETRASALSTQLNDGYRNGFYGLCYTTSLTQPAFEKASGEESTLSFALAKKPSDKGTLRNLVRYSYQTMPKAYPYAKGSTGFVLSNYLMNVYLAANTLADSARMVFFWIAFVSAIFASLGLLNFILLSISAKKREIGILRGLGASGKDIFSIFFNETLLIVLLEWLVSLFGGWGWCTLFNHSLYQGVGFSLYLFNFTFRQVFVVLGIALLTALVATFVPCYLIAKKKPIDSINNR